MKLETSTRSYRSFVALAVVVMFILTLGTNAQAQTPANRIDLSGVRVAVYFGDQSSSQSSRNALTFMFQWMNASTDLLYASDIIDGELSNYDMVVIPGGWAVTYNSELGTTGITEIRQFVREGGAFFGVCAGAYFACDKITWEETTYDYSLDLFDGTGVGPIEEIASWPNYDMCEISVNHSLDIIDFSGEPFTHSVMYYGGPYFESESQDGVHTLATFSVNGKSAMIAFEYNSGRVFLSGPHPEWEEDSQRDNSIWENEFDDQGSEWDMMMKVSLWLVEDLEPSTTPPPTLALSFEQSVAIAAALLVIVALVMYRAKIR
jgi:glutamine amidotransferase-like uncharacterized protein